MPRDTRSRRRRQVSRAAGHALFALMACLGLAATLLTLNGMAPLLSASTSPAASRPASTPASAGGTPAPTGGARNADAVRSRLQIYPAGDPRASLMQPVLDREGNIWFGEMRANKLARLDPRTGKITEWQAPGGRYGLMSTTLGPDGMLWFAEEDAGFIGRFDPNTERFTTYPVEQFQGRTAMPERLRFDTTGKLWFTINRSGQIGRLDPASREIRTWDVLPLNETSPSRPYSIALAPDGAVWFGAALRGGVVGRLDPATGAVKVYRLNEPTAQVTTMASGRDGIVWFTELEYNRLGRIDTRTGKVTELEIPEPVGATTGNYAVDVGPDGKVWFTSTNANAIIAYDPSTGRFRFHALPVPESVPYGIAAAPDGTVWFTADGEPADYVGRVLP